MRKKLSVIPSGSTVYLTTHVQLTPESEQKINAVLAYNNTGDSSDGPITAGCAVKVNPHRYTDTALFKVVYRRDGNAKVTLATDIAKSKLAKMETSNVRKHRSSFAIGHGPTLQHFPASGPAMYSSFMNSSLGTNSAPNSHEATLPQQTSDDWTLNKTHANQKELELRDAADAEADFGEVSTLS